MKLKNEENHVQILRAVWVKLASELEGKRMYVQKIKKGTKSWDMCTRVINFCWEMGISPEEYMFAIHSLYSKDWLMRQLGRVCTPLNIILSTNNFDRAHQIFYPEVESKEESFNEDVINYKNLLEGVSKDVALELIKCGFCGTNSKVLNEVTKIINQREN